MNTIIESIAIVLIAFAVIALSTSNTRDEILKFDNNYKIEKICVDKSVYSCNEYEHIINNIIVNVVEYNEAKSEINNLKAKVSIIENVIYLLLVVYFGILFFGNIVVSAAREG